MTTGIGGAVPAAVVPGLMSPASTSAAPGRPTREGRPPTGEASDRSVPSPARWSAVHRIRVLVGVLAAVAAALFLGVVPHLNAPQAPMHLPWVVWVGAFAVGETLVVHVQVRRDSHSFSLTDLILVAALCLCQPTALVTAQVAGTGLALLLHRRQFNIKLVFNLVQFALGGCLATTVFTSLTRGAVWSSPQVWAGALLAVTVSTMAADLCIFTAISLSEGSGSWRALRQLVEFSLPFTFATGAVGLLVVRTAVLDPAALVLFTVPTVLMLASYRAYSHARQQQDNLRLLHEVTSLLYDSSNISDGLGEFLTAVRGALKAGLAEIVLLGEDSEATTISRSRENQDAAALQPLTETDDAAALIPAASAAGPLSTRTGTGASPALQDYVTRRGLKNAMMTVLRTEEQVYGLLLVGNRLGEVSSFTGSDLALLETFARHVATSLERGRLHGDLRQLAELQDKLRHQAMHDALTGLPNRTLFLDRAATALQLADRTAISPAIFYLDLDGFKPVNDTYGHEAGDLLLQAFAQRLTSCLRGADTAARLGGDEFAVLVNGPIDADGVDRVVGRIRAQLATPIQLGGGQQATIGASIGIAIADAGTRDVETLLRRADTAMYTAKRAPDGRHVLHDPDLPDTPT